ncbi:MAG: carboxypeptidase-like regulatory domain-containing protein [Bryobacteraceae bacterium]|nr:carboxypeptidase-like regulatory domain-containing protein [Bryobacteraceae bacterium]
MNGRWSILALGVAGAAWGQIVETAPGNGSLFGRVAAAGLTMPAGVTVSLVRVSPLPRVTAQAQTNPLGTFYAGNLTPGEYMVCAQSADGLVTDICHWNNVRKMVSIRAGQQSRVTVPALKAQRLKIRVRGVERFARQAGRPDAELAVGVKGPAMREFLTARLVGSSVANGVEYEVIVPVEQDVVVKVNSGRIKIADEAGRDHDVTPRVERAAANGPKEKVINFTAAALRAGVQQ